MHADLVVNCLLTCPEYNLRERYKIVKRLKSYSVTPKTRKTSLPKMLLLFYEGRLLYVGLFFRQEEFFHTTRFASADLNNVAVIIFGGRCLKIPVVIRKARISPSRTQNGSVSRSDGDYVLCKTQ